MSTQIKSLKIPIANTHLNAHILSPSANLPGVLFIHGWGGSQQRDLIRAKAIAGLGCICVTFDLRGHEHSDFPKSDVTREHSLADTLAAYDHLIAQPGIDKNSIAVIGTSYGGYLATCLSALRPVKWLALRAPALYRDEDWFAPKEQLNREDLISYRNQPQNPQHNKALAACTQFTGDVLLVESEQDDIVPHPVMMSYRSAFEQTHSFTHRILRGADHALSNESSQKAYTAILSAWISEMVIGDRTGEHPHLSTF